MSYWRSKASFPRRTWPGAHWVTVEHWHVLRLREFEEELKRAHAPIYNKLPKRTKTVLALPEKERNK